MLSLLIPSNINLFIAPNYIKLEGPNGSFLKKIGNLKCYLIQNQEESRLFIIGNSFQEESTALSHIFKLCIGLARGYRRRLRLVGIGFRAQLREINASLINQKGNLSFFTKKFRRKRRIDNSYFTNSNKLLSLKIGFSHEYSYPLNISKNVQISVSRLEGRSKGTVISLQGKDIATLNQVASEIRSFRFPDSYKGKGIHYDREILKLKKGKRQG